MNNLDRFLQAQEDSYKTALTEIKSARKQSHWMWYIFPQAAGLGQSEMSKRYAINDLEEAKAYLDHPILGARLIEISNAVLKVENKTANEIFGYPDNMKLRSCMELFASVPDADPIFRKVLHKYFS